jgi:hypothetical protein
LWLKEYAKSTSYCLEIFRERDSRKAVTNKTAVSGVKMTGMYSRVRNLIPDSELTVTDARMGMHSTLRTDLVAGT